MAVYSGVAVSWEMLRGDQHRVFGIGVRAIDVRRHMRGDFLGILSERTDVDHGVFRIIVHVGHRREDPLNSEGAGFPSGHHSFVVGSVRIARSGVGHAVRKFCRIADAHGGAAFKVASNNERRSRHSLHLVQK